MAYSFSSPTVTTGAAVEVEPSVDTVVIEIPFSISLISLDVASFYRIIEDDILNSDTFIC